MLARIAAPYGIDIILRYHRQIALDAVTLILLHPAIIVIENPSRLVLLNPLRSNVARPTRPSSSSSVFGRSFLRSRDKRGARLTHYVLGATEVTHVAAAKRLAARLRCRQQHYLSLNFRLGMSFG